MCKFVGKWVQSPPITGQISVIATNDVARDDINSIKLNRI